MSFHAMRLVPKFLVFWSAFAGLAGAREKIDVVVMQNGLPEKCWVHYSNPRARHARDEGEGQSLARHRHRGEPAPRLMIQRISKRYYSLTVLTIGELAWLWGGCEPPTFGL